VAIDLLTFVIVGLAVYRISDMLADDTQEGPWDILTRFRNLVGVFYDEYGVQQGSNIIARMVVCIYCNSFWVGLLATAGWLLVPDVTVVISLPFALSGAAVLLYESTS
jgi:hypothetical protein